MDTKSSNRLKKENEVQVLTDKLTRAKSVVFADFRGMKMPQIQSLRAKLKESGAEFSVSKNTLVKKSLIDSGYTGVNDEDFQGPIGTLFSYEDEVSPLKTIVNFKKENDAPQIKFGFFEKKFISDTEISQLASLPSRPELYAKVVGGLSSPIYSIVGVLQANLRNLVYTLDQIRAQKS